MSVCGGGGGRIVGYEGVGVWFIPSLLPPFFLSLSFSLPHSGVWFTEYGYIDIDSTATSEAACNRQNNSMVTGGCGHPEISFSHLNVLSFLGLPLACRVAGRGSTILATAGTVCLLTLHGGFRISQVTQQNLQLLE